MMPDPIARQPTQEETEQARATALAMNESLLTAPSVGVGLGAIGMLTVEAFLAAVKLEYVLQAYDMHAADIRMKLEEGVRRARN